jgi:hypothetical protein
VFALKQYPFVPSSPFSSFGLMTHVSFRFTDVYQAHREWDCYKKLPRHRNLLTVFALRWRQDWTRAEMVAFFHCALCVCVQSILLCRSPSSSTTLLSSPSMHPGSLEALLAP